MGQRIHRHSIVKEQPVQGRKPKDNRDEKPPTLGKKQVQGGEGSSLGRGAPGTLCWFGTIAGEVADT